MAINQKLDDWNFQKSLEQVRRMDKQKTWNGGWFALYSRPFQA